jgi:hypothetical protein
MPASKEARLFMSMMICFMLDDECFSFCFAVVLRAVFHDHRNCVLLIFLICKESHIPRHN